MNAVVEQRQLCISLVLSLNLAVPEIPTQFPELRKEQLSIPNLTPSCHSGRCGEVDHDRGAMAFLRQDHRAACLLLPLIIHSFIPSPFFSSLLGSLPGFQVSLQFSFQMH